MSVPVFSTGWWVAAGQRAAYTALAALLPLAALLITGEVTPLYVLSVVALALLFSLVTSLKGLPEITDRTVPIWRAVIVRVLKTVGQVGVPVLGSVVLLEQVDWHNLAVAVGGAALTTLVRTFMAYLPESGDVLFADAVVELPDGTQVSGTIPAPPA